MNKVYDLSEVTADHLGCWIDGSNMSGAELDIQIVETAIHFGWGINVEDWKELKWQIDETYDTQVFEDLSNVAEDAIWWAETKLPDGYHFEIDANCLFLTHEDLELINE